MYLPLVPTDIQRLVFDHPVDVRVGVTSGLTVQDGCVTLVHGCILWFHLKANVHCVCTITHTIINTTLYTTSEPYYLLYRLDKPNVIHYWAIKRPPSTQ